MELSIHLPALSGNLLSLRWAFWRTCVYCGMIMDLLCLGTEFIWPQRDAFCGFDVLSEYFSWPLTFTILEWLLVLHAALRVLGLTSWSSDLCYLDFIVMNFHTCYYWLRLAWYERLNRVSVHVLTELWFNARLTHSLPQLRQPVLSSVWMRLLRTPRYTSPPSHVTALWIYFFSTLCCKGYSLS